MTMPTSAVVGAEYRNAAFEARAQYQAATEAIRNDRTLSDEGKQTQLADWRTKTEQTIADLERRETQAVQGRISDLKGQLLDRPTWEDADPINYRDATQRATALTDEQSAIALLTQSMDDRDTILTRAVLRAGYDNRWPEVINTYTARNPHRYNAAEELWELTTTNAKDQLMNDILRGMTYGL
jgi:hypothetical protein